ncbi:MAG: undecaprenyl-diphosphate phosphatase [Candidatus Omnitrophica bacterium]|nr:undecaprenyl-diphosphate phosphatase [Candidatus Omnitrophota bacterium]
MNIVHAIIFGIVEGASEFLPISSTGHLILTARLMGVAQGDFLKSFEITIQLGAILAVVVLYWKSFLVNLNILKRVLTAFFPTALLGLIFYKKIKALLGNDQVVLWSLFLGGVVLILFELFHRKEKEQIQRIESISYGHAVLIGIFQSFSMIPGVSRAAATIIGGLALGLERKTIVEFSFLLAIPTMAAASGLDLLKHGSSFSLDQFQLLVIGFITSFAMAILCIKWLLHFIQHHNFIPFGIYRILLPLIFWFTWQSF